MNANSAAKMRQRMKTSQAASRVGRGRFLIQDQYIENVTNVRIIYTKIRKSM